jgi:hypothetical protein
MEKLQEFTTKKGIKVEIKKSETEGLSLHWMDEEGWRNTHCYDYGETIPTNYEFRTKEHKKSYRRISDEQVVIDLFNKIKSKRWFCKLGFSDISSIIYKHLKEIYGDEGFRYYSTGYAD